MNEAIISTIGQRLQDAQRILIASHIRPDGDAIGSLLGLGLALKEAGKEVHMVSSDGVPTSFRHLPGSDQVSYHAEGVFDLVIVVDCSDLQRVGNALNGAKQVGKIKQNSDPIIPDLNIDHHITNLDFAMYNLVEPGAVATSEILAKYLPAFKLPITQPVSEALLTGIITDTLGFRTSNVTPDTMLMVAELMKYGADLSTLYAKALLSHSYESIRYWGTGLSRMQRQGTIIWTSLTLEDRKTVNYPGRDDADLINVLSSIIDAEIAIIFVEQTEGHVKVSWRAQPGGDVSKVAVAFGGGGHKAAAGADIQGTLEEVQDKVLTMTQALFNGDHL